MKLISYCVLVCTTIAATPTYADGPPSSISEIVGPFIGRQAGHTPHAEKQTATPFAQYEKTPGQEETKAVSIRENGTSVTFSNLYNDEIVTLPKWIWEEVKDYDESLKEKLSSSDYLEILKGILYAFGQYKTKNEYLSERGLYDPSAPYAGSNVYYVEELREKLKKILAHPEDDNVFTRPRFIESKDGVQFRARLRYSNDTLVFSDESFVVGHADGLSAENSSLWNFWDTKTCLLKAQFASQSFTTFAPLTTDYNERSPLSRETGLGSVYLLLGAAMDTFSPDWSGRWSSYLIAPSVRLFQAYGSYDGLGKEFDQVQRESGYLYRQSKPVPPFSWDIDSTEEMRKDPPRPWHRSKAAGLELLHKPLAHDDLGFAWGDGSSRRGTYLVLDTLIARYSNSPIQEQAAHTEQIKNAIRQSMQPMPLDVNNDEMAYIDVGNTQNGYVLFTRSIGHFDHGTDGFTYMFGLLTPDGHTYFFPCGDEGLPHTGKLARYEDCVHPCRVLKYQESEFKHKNPDVPYVIVDDNKAWGGNIKDQYTGVFANNGAPYFKTVETNLAADGKSLELVVGIDVAYNESCMYIIHLDLQDYTYEIKHQWKYRSHALKPEWVSNKKIFLRPESDSRYNIIKIEEGKEEQYLADLYIESPQKYAIVLPDGRYAGPPGCENILEFREGAYVMGMKALAPWRNRPADVLEALGGNPDDIAALRETTKRWLSKQGFDPEKMPKEPALNEFPVAEVEIPELFSSQDKARFRVKLRAAIHHISQVEVRADGCLVPQSWDDTLNVAAGEEKEIIVEVPLANGQNWIEITPKDASGISGDTTQFRTIYKGNYPSDLFIVALGVSDYDDPDLKLQYAAKDAKDIAAAFEKYGAGRKRTLVLTDKEVKDRSVLDRVRAFLAAATIDDRIVLYIAGHGMLDDKLNYYYAPAGFDAEHIAETGIPMEELTACLHDVKARHRLLLLDTCHSGMLGEEGEDRLAMSGVQLPHGVRAIQHRGMKVKKAMEALNTNQKKRYIEDMFSLGNTERGINIIAGAAGAEFALESESWNNGVFTASIIRSLSGEDAALDEDGDGFFSVEELQKRVLATVQQQTAGKQKPSLVCVEGSENMVLAQSVGYHVLKKMIEQKQWDKVRDCIARSPKNYKEGESEDLVTQAMGEAPIDIVKMLLEHGSASNRNYINSLVTLLRVNNPEYEYHKKELAQLLFDKGIEKGDLKTFIWYNPKNEGDEGLVQVLCKNGVWNIEKPFLCDRSLKLFEILLDNGIDPDSGCTGEDMPEALQRYIRDQIEGALYKEYQNNPAILSQKLSLLKNYTASATPLYILAYHYGHTYAHNPAKQEDILRKMKLLLKHGADPNAGEGKNDQLSYRVHGVSQTTPLHAVFASLGAPFRDLLPVIKLLISHGANIHQTDCKGSKPMSPLEDRYKDLVQLYEAAQSGRSLDEVVIGVSPAMAPYTPEQTTYGDNSLAPMIQQISAMSSSDATMQLYRKRLLTLLPLIQNGADVNTTLQETKGNTALHYACGMGYYDLVRWLVEHGANVNQRTNAGKTPMDCIGGAEGARIRQYLKSPGSTSYPAIQSNSYSQATSMGLSNMISTIRTMVCRDDTSKLYQKRLLTLLPLIENGADVNTTLQETKGNTALHYACGMGYYDLVQWLVTHGANVNRLTNAGKTPLDCVGSGDAKRIRELLISQGARNSR